MISRIGVWLAIPSGALLLSVAGCRTHSRATAEQPRGLTSSVPDSAPPIGGTYCLETFAQAPGSARALHFNYKETGSDGSFTTYAGDLAGDNLDATIQERRIASEIDKEMASDKALSAPPVVDGFVETSRSQHVQRSDPSAWSMASAGSVHAFAPWGLFIAKPNVKQVGTETVSGFESAKYTVDTDGQSQMEKMPLTLTGGLKDYTIKGSVWVDSKQRCILQYGIDYEGVKKDGSISKTHYEGNTTRE